MMYSTVDTGNFFVIPGSPTEAWEADNFIALDKSNIRSSMDYGPNDFIIVILGNQLLYKGLWLEHALVLQALLPILKDFPEDGNSSSLLKLIILSGDSSSNYSKAVEVKQFSLILVFLFTHLHNHLQSPREKEKLYVYISGFLCYFFY